jgi:Glu-tRNA(Gln) amidotransferase subunit E-like FAD-binding protein
MENNYMTSVEAMEIIAHNVRVYKSALDYQSSIGSMLMATDVVDPIDSMKKMSLDAENAASASLTKIIAICSKIQAKEVKNDCT